MSPSSNQHYRLSDLERREAMDALGTHYAAGRLTIDEYEERVQITAEARMRSDLNVVFEDLPSAESAEVPMPLTPEQLFDASNGTSPALYSAAEIAQFRRSGIRSRVGIFGLIGLTPIAAAALSASDAIVALACLLWLASFILLFVSKVGPDRWYVPSESALRRARMRAIKEQQRQHQLELEAEHARKRLEQRAMRRQHFDEIGTAASGIAASVASRIQRPK